MPEWSQEKTKVLIYLWEKYPELYVVTSKDYHNKTKKTNAISNIRSELNKSTNETFSSQEITKKMHGLRTQYKREKAKEVKSVSSGCSRDDVYVSPLWSFPLLNFLNESAPVRSSIDNLSPSNLLSPLNVDHLVDELEEENLETEFESPIQELDITKTPQNTIEIPKINKKRKISESSSQISTAMEQATETLKKLAEPIFMPDSPPTDSITAFSKTVEAELREIKSSKRLRTLKTKILNLIYNSQEEEESD